MEQIFTLRTFVPRFVEWQHLVGDGNFPQAVFGLAGNHIKVLFFQMHVFLLQVEELRDAAAVVDQHQHDLIVRVLCKLPQAGDLLLCELVPVTLVGVLILVPAQIHKLGIILVADVIFHGVGIQLVEQPLELFQSRVILPAGVHHKLEIHQTNVPKHLVVKCSAYPIGRLIAFYI